MSAADHHRNFLKLGDEIVHIMRQTFNTPLNYRPAHAKGEFVKGTFRPSKDASKLSKAPIFHQPSTPLIMRFSNDTGLKDIADNGENASRGFAIRFVLSNDGHQTYDIVTNNACGFSVATPEEFIDMFKAVRDNTMPKFLDRHPPAKYFDENIAPVHSHSFATEQWHGVQAFKFINAEGKERFFRWRIVPWQGLRQYSKADAAKQSKNYHFEDLERRLMHHKPIKYRLLAQLAEKGDPTNDSSKVWPESNEFVEMGEIIVERLWSMNEGHPPGLEQKQIFFDPMPRHVQGIQAGDDPLIELRSAAYWMSGKIRRDHIN